MRTEKRNPTSYISQQVQCASLLVMANNSKPSKSKTIKKSSSKKVATKKATSKTVKKAAPKKAATNKAVAKKAPAKKAAVKKAPAKKAPAKKAVAKAESKKATVEADVTTVDMKADPIDWLNDIPSVDYAENVVNDAVGRTSIPAKKGLLGKFFSKFSS